MQNIAILFGYKETKVEEAKEILALIRVGVLRREQ
jgi:hypothetical protein